ncbi:MAG: hypothetical protein IPK99_15310 [Flavobacteriales bacterium]|nr:hypothetical protein [Flavobacteriales bacterium]
MPVIGLLPVTGAATPSLTLVVMLKLVLKFAAGTKVTPASKMFTLAIAPLAVHTPALKMEVTAPEVAVLNDPTDASDKVSVAVVVAWSTSLTTMSIRFNETSSV